MLKTTVVLLTLMPFVLPQQSLAEGFSYAAIAERYPDSQLSAAAVNDFEMQGECLVGLKELNFQKREDFDPVVEWTNFRAISLLEQFPPCKVLVMIEVARRELLKNN